MSEQEFEGYGSNETVIFSGTSVMTEEVIEDAARRAMENFGVPGPAEVLWHRDHWRPLLIIFEMRKYRGKVSKRRWNNIFKMRMKRSIETDDNG